MTSADDKVFEKREWIPARAVLGILLFMISAASYMHGSNMGVIIVDMVVPPKTSIFGDPMCTSGNETHDYVNDSPADIADRYDWSQILQSVILSVYYLGYSITHIPGGMLAERFGARSVVFWTSVVSSVCTALIPLCAEGHYSLVIINRLIVGLCGGVVYPAMHAAIARWVPPNEKSKFVWCTIGGTFGTMATFPLCGAVVHAWGWRTAFYITAAIMLVLCFVWFFLMHNTPQEHPRISQKELVYIENAIGYDISKREKQKFPARKVFTSVPVIVLVFLQIGDVWGLFFPQSYGPKFMKEALGFDVQSTGGLAALPYLSRLLFGIIFSAITDYIRTRKLMSVTRLRKTMTIFSHLVPAVFLFLVGEVGCSPYISILCLTLSLGFNGAAVGSCLANPHDLAPNFAGTIFGIQNGVASVFSAMSGFIAGAITKERSGLTEWRIVWDIGAGVYVFTAALFFIWGTGERQDWNNVDDSTASDENSKSGTQNTSDMEMATKLHTAEDVNSK